MLRQLDTPLSAVKRLLALPRSEAAALVEEHWRVTDAAHASRRELALYLINQLNGKRSDMYEVATREMPERRVLCLKRNVDEAGAWALGKEFIAIMRESSAAEDRRTRRCGVRHLLGRGERRQRRPGGVVSTDTQRRRRDSRLAVPRAGPSDRTGAPRGVRRHRRRIASGCGTVPTRLRGPSSMGERERPQYNEPRTRAR